MNSHYRRFIHALLCTGAFVLASTNHSIADAIVTFEAESGTLGANFITGNSGGVIYISNTNNNATANPGIPGRVASYSVTFPAAGTYNLYGRVRVGAGAANDDSFFYGNGFGAKSATTTGDWVLVNSIDARGFVNPDEVVTTGGSAGSSVWKWINFSQDTGAAGGTPITFTVTAGNLSPTFQIGSREDGLDFDKFVFGTTGTAFAVSNLDTGTLPAPPAPPAAPTGLTATPGESLVSLSWTASAGATSYNVKRATVSGGPYTTITNVSATSFANTGLTDGTTYYYVVSALSVNGEGNDSSEANATPAPLPPAIPTDLAAAPANAQVALSWTASAGATSYNVKRATVNGGPYTAITNVPTPNFVNTGLINGTVYYFVVSALNANGESANSSQASAVPTATPSVPSGVLHGFTALSNGNNTDGANPSAGLALVNGVLCGTTFRGGSQGAGTAFYMSADGSSFVTVRSFASVPDANNPAGELSFSGSGFFGTSFAGGSGSVGAVFIGQTNGTESVIRNFSTLSADYATNSGGVSPTATLALSGNTLYGATTAGGLAANGTIYSLTTNGTTFTALHNFSLLNAQSGTNVDGATPWGGLISSGGTLYGTASAGGNGGNGVVFSMNTSGANFTTLYSFSPMDTVTPTNADGAMPYGGLVLSNGTLYGTTFVGGQGGRGTIFSIQTNGLGFTVLHHFTVTDPVTRTNTDGASPRAGLILSGNVLYGTASAGGTGAVGTVFSLNVNGTQFSTLQSFGALASNGTNTSGAFPVAPVLQFGNSLYGTTFSGGSGAAGTVFSLALSTSTPPAMPAVITNIVRNLDGTVTLYFLGGPNSTNVIEAADNLTAPVPWQSVSTNVADSNGAWQFNDSNNTDTATRFYRSYAP